MFSIFSPELVLNMKISDLFLIFERPCAAEVFDWILSQNSIPTSWLHWRIWRQTRPSWTWRWAARGRRCRATRSSSPPARPTSRRSWPTTPAATPSSYSMTSSWRSGQEDVEARSEETEKENKSCGGGDLNLSVKSLLQQNNCPASPLQLHLPPPALLHPAQHPGN